MQIVTSWMQKGLEQVIEQGIERALLNFEVLADLLRWLKTHRG